VRKRSSWLTTTKAPSYAFSALSSCLTPRRSRLLVGSSSRSSCGAGSEYRTQTRVEAFAAGQDTDRQVDACTAEQEAGLHCQALVEHSDTEDHRQHHRRSGEQRQRLTKDELGEHPQLPKCS
jgi:hypothetical protein